MLAGGLDLEAGLIAVPWLLSRRVVPRKLPVMVSPPDA